MKLKGRAAGLIVLAQLMTSGVAHAADFPSKPIRIVVPFNPGSGSDETSRVYGEIVSKLSGQSVLVENKPGASGLLAIKETKAQPADGYTLMLASNSPMAVNPVVIKDMQYDPFKDFRPVSGLSVGPAAFVVRAESPFRTMKDLVHAAKKEKRSLTVGNYSAGYNLIAAWLGTAAGVEFTHVPYKGGAQMVTDVLGGNLDVGVNDFGGLTSMLKGGKVRVLAITSAERDKRMFPDVPTMIESGFPGFESYVWASLFVRAETPDAIVERLADLFMKALTSEEGMAYQARRPGLPLLLGPREMREFQLREYERFKRVADAAGITPQ